MDWLNASKHLIGKKNRRSKASLERLPKSRNKVRAENHLI